MVINGCSCNFKQMRSSYEASTTSLDRQKLYRSKAETRAAKRASLSRVSCLPLDDIQKDIHMG